MGIIINKTSYSGQPLFYGRVQNITHDFATNKITFDLIGMGEKYSSLDRNNVLQKVQVSAPTEFPTDITKFCYEQLFERFPEWFGVET